MTLGIILFIALYALAWLAVLGDHSTSQQFPYFGLDEKNKLTRDRYGFYNGGKILLLSALGLIVVGVCGGIGIYIGEEMVVYICAMMGGVIAVTRGAFGYLNNTKQMKIHREKQVGFLNSIRTLNQQGAEDVDYQTKFQTLEFKTTGGLNRYKLFGWINNKETDLSLAVDDCQRKIKELASKDEGQWFVK